MKSYGRAPTFLLRTGYEQVRSVVAALAGDWEAARAGRAGAAGDRRLQPSPRAVEPTPASACAAAARATRRGCGAASRARAGSHGRRVTIARVGDRRRALGHRDGLLGRPLLRLRGLPAADAARARLLGRPSSPAPSRSRCSSPAVAGIAVGRYLDRRGPRGLMTPARSPARCSSSRGRACTAWPPSTRCGSASGWSWPRSSTSRPSPSRQVVSRRRRTPACADRRDAGRRPGELHLPAALPGADRRPRLARRARDPRGRSSP